MAQHDYNIANQGFSSFRSDLNNALSAIQTTNSGTSLPTGAVAGQIWLDTTNATSPTLKFYDGADSISLATINYTANTVDWLDSSVSITGLSTSATGTVLTLSDTASTSSVNLIIDNQKEVRFRETTANGTNYVGLKAPASLSADLTYTLPSADGTNGQALVTNGSGVLSFTTISAGTSWQSVQTSGFTAVSGRGYPCNTTSSAFTVTLPSSASVGDYVQIVDYAGTFATNAITLAPNGLKIESSTSNKLLTTNREAVTLVYVDSTQGWVSTSASNYGTQSIDPVTYSADILVVGGGGSGGAGVSGGGGAGGYRTSTQTLTGSTVYTITVGDGGATATGSPNGSSGTNGSQGSSSSISGSGLTTITSAGGGGGGGDFGSSSTGGSGGGGGRGTPTNRQGASGNTPSTSPSQGNNGGNGYPSPARGGGGGGAGAVGNDASPSSTANGGNGTASSITGSSVTYAGGGGGGGDIGNSPDTSGGTGGGGRGGISGSVAGVAGTANLGGGGGGGSNQGANGNGGAGGKGVVILSVPTSRYSGTTTGSPTVTTSGSNTIIQFTGSGSYTA